MPKRFAATENAFEKGITKTTPQAGAKLVADWAKELEKLDTPGAKAIHSDLLQLEKELTKDDPDGDRLKKIMNKLGSETTKIAGKVDDEKVAEKLRSLGEGLTEAAA